MTDAQPRLYADINGVWREDGRGRPSGILWNDVSRVSGHKLDAVTEVFTCVELDWEFGKCFELYQDWPGFSQVVDAITTTLPGITSDWFAQVERLRTIDPPIEVWRRS